MKKLLKKIKLHLYFYRCKWLRPSALTLFGLLLSGTELGLWAVLPGAAWLTGLLTIRLLAPSDQQVDQWLAQEIAWTKEKAMRKIGLDRDDPQQDPLEIVGVPWQGPNRAAVKHLRFKKSRKKLYRFSAHDFLFLFLAEDRLCIYRSTFDSLRQINLGVKTLEYAYHDVIGVMLEENVEVFDGDDENAYFNASGDKITPSQFFTLSVRNGEKVSVAVSARRLKDKVGDVPMTELDRTVSAVRALIRRKQTELPLASGL